MSSIGPTPSYTVDTGLVSTRLPGERSTPPHPFWSDGFVGPLSPEEAERAALIRESIREEEARAIRTELEAWERFLMEHRP